MIREHDLRNCSLTSMSTDGRTHSPGPVGPERPLMVVARGRLGLFIGMQMFVALCDQ